MRIEDVEQCLKEQEAILEGYYPGWIAELAQRLHEKESVIEAKIASMVQISGQSKYTLAYTLLTYHRLADHW